MVELFTKSVSKPFNQGKKKKKKKTQPKQYLPRAAVVNVHDYSSNRCYSPKQLLNNYNQDYFIRKDLEDKIESTFKPEINKKSKRLASAKRQSTEKPENNLLYYGKLYEKRKQQLQIAKMESEKQICTFQPNKEKKKSIEREYY